MKSKYILGIDTSNYKTSLAVTDQQQNVICDLRVFLKVKQGERGLRQSDALFQHIRNIPVLMEQLRESGPYQFEAISYSSRPRPAEGSYMPVFLAGESYARTLAAALGIPAFAFSHQEGHIEAIKAFSTCREDDEILACHFSGGTSELLHVKSRNCGYNIEIVGGSKDIAFGQVIDRAGVAMGMSFPAGEEMDRLAAVSDAASKLLTSVKVRDAWLNLSGIDTQMKRALEAQVPQEPGNPSEVMCSSDNSRRNDLQYCGMLVRELFERLADAMVNMVAQGAEKTGIRKVLMAGGVTSSMFMREKIRASLGKLDIHAEFDDRGLAQDNAVGTAILGGKCLWP